jgi:hypothetical protein
MPDADHLEGEFVNLQMFRILGLTPPDSRRRAPADDAGPDGRRLYEGRFPRRSSGGFRPGPKMPSRRLQRRASFSAGSYRIVKKDGGSVWINQDAILREIRPDCRVFYATYRVVDREIELQAELERQLEKEKLLRDQADAANAAKSDFLSRMSHDIRTPLNGIIGMTYLTKEMELPQRGRSKIWPRSTPPPSSC